MALLLAMSLIDSTLMRHLECIEVRLSMVDIRRV